MTEENIVNDRKESKQDPQFNCFIKIFFNTVTKDFAFETNVPDTITGFGLCDLGKKGVETHIAKMQQKLVKPANGIMNFVRRK